MAQEKKEKSQIKKAEELQSALPVQAEVKVTQISDPLPHPSQIDEEKMINPSTLWPEGQGLLRVDPERRFFTPPSQAGFGATEWVKDLSITEMSFTSPSDTELTLKREENQLTLKEPFTKNENSPISFSHFHPKESQGTPSTQPDSSEASKMAMNNPSFSDREDRWVQGNYSEKPKPHYPNEARKKGYQGKVVLRVEVLSNGLVGKVEVKSSSGYEVLDRAALADVKQRKFNPAKVGGKSVSSWMDIPIKFQLQ